MSDTSQATAPAGNAPAVDDVDDGFTPEERAQFAEMEKVDSGSPAEPEPAPAPVPAPAAAPAPAADAEDDDDDEDAGEAAGGAGAPAAAPGAAPAAGAAGGPAEGEPKPKKRVSARKYEREAAARKTAETELAKTRENQARLDERMRIINEALTPPAKTAADEEAEDPEPDAEKDIFAWVAWKKRDDARLREEMAELRSGRQAETEDQQLSTSYIEDSRAYAAKEPNFVPAYQFLMANRTYELAQYFFQKDLTDEAQQLTPDELVKIRQTIQGEEKQLVSGALQNRRSPADAIFKLAKARGYRPAAPAATNGSGAAAPAAGAAPAAAVPGALAAAAAPSVVAEIARIKAGSEGAKSLSDAGGAPASALTPEKLAAMSEEDFGDLVDSLSPEAQRKLFGE